MITKRAFTLIELLVVIIVIIFLVGVLLPGVGGPRSRAIQLVCQTNLAGIGQAMHLWANEHTGSYPRAGDEVGVWSDVGRLYDWDAASEADAFRDGMATVTSSLYLLTKYYGVGPKQFVCGGDDGAMPFKIRYITRTRINNFSQAWDFGDGSYPLYIPPGGYCSYAYHMPYFDPATYESVTVTDEFNPRSPVCADRNPFLDGNVTDPQVGDNSAAHLGRGQNVLYRDGSTRFEKTVTVGINGDNIYTYGDYGSGGGDPNGTPPVGNGDGAPSGQNDAYIVGDRNR
ncbi:MAG: hypothetical protein ACYTBJ_05630 [Planctomycetota bacterium]|jgi:hypothetical protein